MQRTKTVKITYEQDKIAVVIEKSTIPIRVHIFKESESEKTDSLGMFLTQHETLQLLSILNTANEEGDI